MAFEGCIAAGARGGMSFVMSRLASDNLVNLSWKLLCVLMYRSRIITSFRAKVRVNMLYLESFPCNNNFCYEEASMLEVKTILCISHR